MSMGVMDSGILLGVPNGYAIPPDKELSLESGNAIANDAVTAALQTIDHDIQVLSELRSSLTQFGFSKICPVNLTDATEDDGLVLGAREKNASVSGTLANKIAELDKFLMKKRGNPPGNDAKLAVETGIYVTNGNTANIPETWSILVVFEASGYILQILRNVYTTTTCFYTRTRNNNNEWGSWSRHEGTAVL